MWADDVDELRETAKDLRFLGHRLMAHSPHRTADEIMDVLEGAEIADRRAALLETIQKAQAEAGGEQ